VKKLQALVASRLAATPTPLLARLRADPARLFTESGLGEPDPWQRDLLRGRDDRLLLCCCRQSGKSTTAAALALREALLRPPALVLLLSPTQRQSAELFRKVLDLFRGLGRPVGVANESALRVELANGSRVVALPGSEETTRGFSSAALVVVDEAARVSDDLVRSVRPMLAVSAGRLILLSTPAGKRGVFYQEWVGGAPWTRVRSSAPQVSRIPAAFLADERRALGPRWYRQEYDPVSFEECVGSLFRQEDIDASFDDGLAPLFVDAPPARPPAYPAATVANDVTPLFARNGR
jgi:hypothetical protein